MGEKAVIPLHTYRRKLVEVERIELSSMRCKRTVIAVILNPRKVRPLFISQWVNRSAPQPPVTGRSLLHIFCASHIYRWGDHPCERRVSILTKVYYYPPSDKSRLIVISGELGLDCGIRTHTIFLTPNQVAFLMALAQIKSN